MLTIKFYKNLSENNDLQKTLEGETVVVGDSRGEINLLRPTILVDSVDINAFNYCYIVELKRFYYVEDFTMRPNGLAVIQLRVDVLMSFQEDIKASSGLILKQRSYNPYYGDFDVESRIDTVKYEFEDKFNHDGEFVLVAFKG